MKRVGVDKALAGLRVGPNLLALGPRRSEKIQRKVRLGEQRHRVKKTCDFPQQLLLLQRLLY